CWNGRRGRRLTGCVSLGISAFLDCGHEAIAIAMDGLEERWHSPTIPNGPAHGSDGALQGGIAEAELRPDGLAQFLLGDVAVMVCQQVREGLEHFTAQTDSLAGTIHDMALYVEFTVPKDVNHGRVFHLIPGRRQTAHCERPRPWQRLSAVPWRVPLSRPG